MAWASRLDAAAPDRVEKHHRPAILAVPVNAARYHRLVRLVRMPSVLVDSPTCA